MGGGEVADAGVCEGSGDPEDASGAAKPNLTAVVPAGPAVQLDGVAHAEAEQWSQSDAGVAGARSGAASSAARPTAML